MIYLEHKKVIPNRTTLSAFGITHLQSFGKHDGTSNEKMFEG